MSAPPPSPTATLSEQDVHAAVQRLAAIDPGPYWVVTCYLKLEPRDRTRGKYLIKMKNRVKESAAALARQSLGHADREAIAADLQRVLDYLEEPNHLPSTRAIAIFASQGLDLFEALPLPHVHRSRLAIDHERLVRELVALDEEFGMILVIVHDRTAARFFEVTAYGDVELTSLAGIDASRASKFHGSHQRQVMARAGRERAWQGPHADAVKDGTPVGWAVNGVDPTLKALSRGQVRTLLADGQDDDQRIDEAVEDALRQRAQVDVLYDDKARRVVKGLAALLRFRAR